MHRLLRAGILIAFGMLFISIISGCGDDNAPTQEVVAPPPLEEHDVGHNYSVPRAHTVEVYPDPCIPVFPDIHFTLNFDEGITAVSVNDTPATGAGRHWTVMPGLKVGTAWLNIEWFNRDTSRGAKTIGPYVVLADGEVLGPPAITNATVVDGAAEVDPASINAGGFRFDFDEPITGIVKLTDEAGVNLHWIASVAFHTATLTPVAGQELVNETTYKIEIDVQDGAGNPLQTTITFVTKPK